MRNIETQEVAVAIIGSGPAGLAAAIELRRQGVGEVLVLEREAEAGGIPRHCGHPPFGFWEYGHIYSGPGYARRNVQEAQDAGVNIALKHTVTHLGAHGLLDGVSPEGSFRIQAQRVLIATGARETPRSARLLGGDRPVGVINTGALQAYLYLQQIKPFERPLIIGTELVSLSAVLSCRRAGIKPVAVLERNSRPTARWPLSLFPRLCGVPLHLGAELIKVHGTGRVESASVRMADGSVQEFACDGVLLTGEFTPESSLARLSELQIDPRSGGPLIDQYGRCSDPRYFAAGNLLRPIETAGWSFREGRQIARLLAQDLRGELPAALGGMRIECQAGLKLCVPQVLLPSPEPGLKHLQLRVNKARRGQLVVRADGREIWRKSRACLPERRLLIALQELDIPRGTQHLEVDFVGE
ncbi:NAD(P)/FAD-dependent oxidoreductase [Pseudomonas sp. 5P_3.1_Bac2]|uniref:NAD(P)/FAD-dependent oxidoreductase n=1 Tax=Pseudomonas sp. 5P_3.1_Bac2 TaxID=2971617 RepID=UPI0021C71FE1|nr:NAD(P)/FAD-dependent oxidoreductase [Pseudomonas sp. 5P_3.1_Bac2]MCU1716808.1 NAD(P)/FAD-dependent oxidoreductase [Pseudomonas sp. 5P_3.1_Bac2]